MVQIGLRNIKNISRFIFLNIEFRVYAGLFLKICVLIKVPNDSISSISHVYFYYVYGPRKITLSREFKH